jgi:uncharacterized protein (TIGR03437 family)
MSIRIAVMTMFVFIVLSLGGMAQTAAPQPRIDPAGVVNAATLTAGISPGAMMFIYGSGLSSDTAGAASPLPTSIVGTQVLVNGVPAPLFYVSPSRITAQVPWEANTAVTLKIQVSVNGVGSNEVFAASKAFSPGVFSVGGGQGAIMTADGALAAPIGFYPGSRPVRPGETISIYANGMGTMTNRPASGAAALAQPASVGRTNPVVTIGGVQATRTFFGLAPGYVGVWLITAQVAASTPGGDAVPVVLSNVGVYTANTVTIAVAAPAFLGVAPSIASFTPDIGPAGTTVALTGANLTGTTAVSFNGVLSTSFAALADDRLTAVVPAGAGAGPVTVTTNTGQTTTSSVFVVTAAGRPVINSFTPLGGPSETEVTLSGSGFQAATAVAVNGSLTSFNVVSDTIIHATVKDGSTTGPVTVTTPGGTATGPTSFQVTTDVEDGPPQGGLINAFAFDPRTPGVLYVSTATGLFKTTNSGANWNPVNAGLLQAVGLVAIDPTDSSTVYAASAEDGSSEGVFKSTDGGGAWATSSSGLAPFTPMKALLMDPSNPATLYAGRVGSGAFKSVDHGVSWFAINVGLTDNTHFFALAIAPAKPSILYAGTRLGGVFKSENGGLNWTAVNTGLTDTDVFALATPSSDPATVYAGTFGGGVFKSTDGGASWQPVNSGLPSPVPAVAFLAIDPSDSATIYAGTFGGVFKSSDGGAHWVMILSDGGPVGIDPFNRSTIFVGTIFGVAKSMDGGSTWVASDRGLSLPVPGIDTLAIDPRSPSTLYAGTADGGRIFKTADGGSTWTSAGNGIPSASLFVRTLVVDPSNSSTIYASAASGVFKSVNGGLNWFAVNNGIPASSLLMPALVIDPGHPSTLYAGSGFGFFKTTDGGANWTAINKGLPAGNTSVRFLVIDPSNTNTLYAGAFLSAYKTTDGGANWTALRAGPVLDAIAVDPTDPNTIYGGQGRGAMRKSVDAGLNWTDLHSGLPSPMPSVQAIALDPSRSSTIYAGTGGGVFKSTDKGATWKSASDGLLDMDVLTLLIDPLNPSTIYVGTGGGIVFKSTDGAVSWKPAAPIRPPVIAPQPDSLSISTNSVSQGVCYVLTAGHASNMTLDVRYTFNDGPVQTAIGWPKLDANGQATACTTTTPLGEYVFTAIRNTLNTSERWVSVDVPITVR